jgi:hypothetical protein
MRPIIAAALLLVASPTPTIAQPPRAAKIQIALEGRSEGRATADANGARLVADVRRGLEAIADVEIVPAERARRAIWIIAGTTAGVSAASVMVTERYDRETLMVLGIEDDDMAARMMSLQIANDHQIFTGADAGEVARRIVAAVDAGVLARWRARR